MARYTGPKHKLVRREGVNILDKIWFTSEKNEYSSRTTWKKKEKKIIRVWRAVKGKTKSKINVWIS